MGNQNKVKIINSPFHSNLEVIDDLVFKLHAPYSKDSVTIKINPYITDYQEKVNENGRQLMKTKDTSETKILQFNFKNNRKHRIMINGKSYRVLLEAVGAITEQGQSFPTFEFIVEKA